MNNESYFLFTDKYYKFEKKKKNEEKWCIGHRRALQRRFNLYDVYEKKVFSQYVNVIKQMKKKW